MKLPHLFRQIHVDQIFNAWVKAGQPPIINVYPREPLHGVVVGPAAICPIDTCTIISVRCANVRGVLHFEAATPTDLALAHEWAARHKDTPPEAFKWVPGQ